MRIPTPESHRWRRERYCTWPGTWPGTWRWSVVYGAEWHPKDEEEKRVDSFFLQDNLKRRKKNGWMSVCVLPLSHYQRKTTLAEDSDRQWQRLVEPTGNRHCRSRTRFIDFNGTGHSATHKRSNQKDAISETWLTLFFSFSYLLFRSSYHLVWIFKVTIITPLASHVHFRFEWGSGFGS